jgi:hypothetical protein
LFGSFDTKKRSILSLFIHFLLPCNISYALASPVDNLRKHVYHQSHLKLIMRFKDLLAL